MQKLSVHIKRKYRGGESITRHWLVNSMGIVTLILLAVEIVLIVIVKSYYYTSAKQYVTSKMNIITTSVMNSAGDTTNYNAEIRNIVESYEDKDRIELMAITADGDVDVTSSGFSLQGGDSMTDYNEAKSSAAGTAAQIIRLATGEKVVAVTSVISPKGCDYEALRMLSSMKNVDHQIGLIAAVITAIVLGIILLMFFTGMYFIRQIVIPIRGIADITHKYAKGDFSKRIEKKARMSLASSAIQ